MAIVGGGLTGLSAARRDRPGAGRVRAVLDRRVVGHGASSRNGGMVHPGGKHDLARASSPTPGDGRCGTTPSRLRRGSVHVDRRARASAASGSAAAMSNWRTTPAWPVHRTQVAAAHESIGEHGRVPRRGGRCRRGRVRIGSSAAWSSHRSAGRRPRPADRRDSSRAAKSSGDALRPRPRSLGSNRAGAGHVRAHDAGPAALPARWWWPPTVRRHAACPWLGRRVLGVGSFIIATEAVDPELVASVSPQGRMLFDTRNFLHYWRLSPDGRRVLFGGRTSLSPTTVPEARDRLYGAMVTIHPQLDGVRVHAPGEARLASRRTGCPHVGRHPGTGVVYAIGYCGSGVRSVDHFGRSRGPVLRSRATQPPFAGRRFLAVPAPGPPVPRAPAVAGWWYLARDALGR